MISSKLVVTIFSTLALLMAQQGPTKAFPSGAGACPKDLAATEAPGSPHVPATTTGGLRDGGLGLTLNGEAVSGSPILLRPNVEYTLGLTGSSAFAGFLLRLDSSTDLTALLPDSSNGQVASICGDEAAGVTHVDNADKTAVSTLLQIDQEGTFALDVTVVVEFGNGVSEYYYTPYVMEVADDDDGPSRPILDFICRVFGIFCNL